MLWEENGDPPLSLTYQLYDQKYMVVQTRQNQKG